ncbi:ribosomal-processing cysteine protease Prp [Peloplasma aerotolerans]|uniref:Ribosomal processing cysteine protease Prp n=1 Tax=Peloplasma aerotolerans TaxID=3044389 RepID=A0AAW6U4W4_9MOLU|nr:ribosomal-processing cysteine protease Prp [Mariniplasma sp. M4Ah]MDI6451960.1 ribosomal-processing cysteine protease Prp [Mariniplasma sp. M4Ah]MDR4969464.1 ribosomal-processing cysteine protease Prp [Acholeplasmataceae bacterium]
MITSKFTYMNQKLNQITVSGHANYKQHGEDIVCAAVSAATLVTANAIEHLKLNHKIGLTVSEGYFKLTLNEEDPIVLGLLENLEYTLNELEKNYPKYIKNQKEG